jgi:hypothetical protein
MKFDEIKQKIDDVDTDRLKDFLLDLYLHRPELHNQIESLVLYNDPAALAKAISKRIQSVSRGRKFIDYRMSFSFARDLESIVADIESGLLDRSPKHAFDLMTKFLATSNKVFERVDDSSGDIGGVYRESVLLWLTAAKTWKESSATGAKVNWLERIYKLYLDNDYAVYDTLLPNSAILLEHDQLAQLAWRYESELRQALKVPDEKGRFNMAASHSCVALGAVAEALKDPDLYARATLIDSPQPNDLQKKSMIEMYLRFEQADKALHWLNTPWEARFEGDRLRLLAKAQLQSGNVDELKQTRFQSYQREKTYSSFMRYFELLDEKEKETARLEAIQLAEKGDVLEINIDMLLSLDEAERAQLLVLANVDDIANCFYERLLKLAIRFEQQACWLAATVCYRGLLWDILNQARYKAYSHAARYYKKLELISENIQRYAPLEEHAEFIKQLDVAHGRKRSFWERVL